jgi:uncharacterized protein involved in exopolysaccharide biosynthesis
MKESMYQETFQPDIVPAPIEARRGLDVFDVLLIFARHKWVLILFTLAGALSLLIWSMMQTKLYTADALMMPPQEQQSSSSLMGQLSVLSVFGGPGGAKSPSDMYIGLLQSRSVLEKIATDFNLMKAYNLPKVEYAAAKLASRTKIAADKDGLITVKVEDQDPKRARDMANDFATGLYSLNSRLAIGQAAQRRLFFDQQLAQEKDRLADAEVALEQVEEKTGFIQLAGQTSATLSRVTQLQANIESREVELASLRTSATDENPEVVRIESEIAGLRNQLTSMQGKPGLDAKDVLGIPSSRVPALSLEYIRKERDVQYHQTLFDLLARQLEAAKIDEAKAAPIVQVVDRAELPVLPTFPKTGLFTALGAILGFILGCVRCVVLYVYDYIDEDPRLHIKWWAVKNELTGRLG